MSQLEATNDEHLQATVEIETEASAMATTMSSTTTVTQSTIDTQASTAETTSTTTSNTTAAALEVLTTALLEADAVDLPEPISVSPVQTSLAAEEVVTTRYFPPSPSDSNVDINNNNIDTHENNHNVSATITNGINIISSNIVSNNMGNNNLNSNNNISSNNNNNHHYNNNTSPNMANSRTNGFAHEFNSFSATEVLATTQPGNGDLVVCNQALSNVCVYHFVPVDELEQSGNNLNANNNNNNNNIGNNNTHHHNSNNHSYMNTNIRPNNPYSPYFNGSLSNGYPHNSIDDHGPQHPNNAEHLRRSQRRRERIRSRRSSRRDKESMRHSLKSMNNFLRKTVNTLRRIKSLILQQVQIARALHLGSQLTMW